MFHSNDIWKGANSGHTVCIITVGAFIGTCVILYTNTVVMSRNIFSGSICSLLYLSPSYAHQQKTWAYTFSFSFSVCAVATHTYTHSNKWDSLSYGLYMYLDMAFQFWTNTWWQLWMGLFIFPLQEGQTILGLLCVPEIFFYCMRTFLTEHLSHDSLLTSSCAFKLILVCLRGVTAMPQGWV